MSISNYKTRDPPAAINNVINQLFKNRLHKKIKVDKTDFQALPSLRLDNSRQQFSQISQRSTFSEHDQTQDKVLLKSTNKIDPQIKLKIIKKQMGQARKMEIAKKIHPKYRDYLVNYLHKGNISLIKRGVPPTLSVLQTIDEGDYVLDDNGTHYERKDYPHYSNVIKTHELPSDTTSFVFVNQPQKIQKEELYFQIQDNCVVKIKQIYQFVSALFKKSIQFIKKMRNIRFTGGPKQNQNHDFQVIATEVNMSYKSTKLMYDILNQFYGFEREMIKNEESKIKAAEETKESLKNLLENYKVNEAVHIPHEELFISLRELRQILHTEFLRLQQESDKDDSD